MMSNKKHYYNKNTQGKIQESPQNRTPQQPQNTPQKPVDVSQKQVDTVQKHHNSFHKQNEPDQNYKSNDNRKSTGDARYLSKPTFRNLRKKSVESAIDIKDDIRRIEKEIELEINTIKTAVL